MLIITKYMLLYEFVRETPKRYYVLPAEKEVPGLGRYRETHIDKTEVLVVDATPELYADLWQLSKQQIQEYQPISERQEREKAELRARHRAELDELRSLQRAELEAVVARHGKQVQH